MMNINILKRSYHQTPINYGAIHKTFRKVMGYNSSKKRKFIMSDTPVPIYQGLCETPKTTRNDKDTSKRISMLNKMFMRNVSDLIINGQDCDQYAKYGIEICRVNVSSDYKNLTIYWISKEVGKDDLISKFLEEDSFSLRHKLSQLRLMGSVPPLSFAKDKKQSALSELDNKIEIADYGDDYERIPTNKMRDSLKVLPGVDETSQMNATKIEIQNYPSHSGEIPPMPHNVFGLEHAHILNKINTMKISDVKMQTPNYVESSKMYKLHDQNEISRDAFKAFLVQRQNIKHKKRKEKYDPYLDYLKYETKEKSCTDHNENIETNMSKFDEDYFTEEYKMK